MAKSRKPSKKSAFDIRMLYAVTPQLREIAAEMGCNWALVYTCGHKHHRSLENPLPNDDLPIWFDSDPAIARLRRANKKKQVKFEQKTLRESVAHAKALGLKAMMHSYEVSIPPELHEVYPRLYRPLVKEYRNCSAETKAAREPCVADPRVREIISQKVAETVKVAPDLDAYAFSYNENLSKARIPHRCENCRDVPFWQMIKWLSDAVRDGVHSVNPAIEFWHRLWGLNEHDFRYYDSLKARQEFSGGESDPWLPRHIEVYKPRSMHYKPSVDLKKYIQLQRDVDMGFIAKGTWADVSIDMPLNPWIKELKAFPTVVEMSFEASSRAGGFHILADNFQRMAKHSRTHDAAGVAGIPVDWGDKYNEDPPPRGFMGEDLWKLSVLNFDVVEALSKNPQANMVNAIDRALKKRYGKKLPRRVAELVIESQTIKSRSVNIRGIRCTGPNLDKMHSEVLRYGPTVGDWDKKLSRDKANVDRIWREKDRNVARANEVLEEIETLAPKLPDKALADLRSSFTDLRDTAIAISERQKLNMLMWAIKEGKIAFDIDAVHRIESCIRKLRRQTQGYGKEV